MAKAIGTVTPIRGVSIQGERQHREQVTMWADDAAVEKYVADVSDPVLACRERGRHLYPTVREVGRRFTGIDKQGRMIRELVCKVCNLVGQIEKWETYRMAGKIRYRMVESRPDYSRVGENGEKYLNDAGQGRMKPRQVKEAAMSLALSGMTPAEVKRAALKGEG